MADTQEAAAPAALAGLYLTRTPVPELAPGDIVISVSRALHLGAKVGHSGGYDYWSYTQHRPGGRYSGTTSLRRDGHAAVIRLPEVPDAAALA